MKILNEIMKICNARQPKKKKPNYRNDDLTPWFFYYGTLKINYVILF
jgi:hypothetical protein